MNGDYLPPSRIRIEEVGDVVILFLDGMPVIRTTDRKWIEQLRARLGKEFAAQGSDEQSDPS